MALLVRFTYITPPLPGTAAPIFHATDSEISALMAARLT